MKRLVQRLINAYENRPDMHTSESARKWEANNISPAKADVEVLMKNMLTVEQMKKMLDSLEVQESQVRAQLKVHEAMIEMIKKQHPEIFQASEGEIIAPQMETSEQMLEEMMPVIKNLRGMLTVIETAELTGSI